MTLGCHQSKRKATVKNEWRVARARTQSNPHTIAIHFDLGKLSWQAFTTRRRSYLKHWIRQLGRRRLRMTRTTWKWKRLNNQSQTYQRRSWTVFSQRMAALRTKTSRSLPTPIWRNSSSSLHHRWTCEREAGSGVTWVNWVPTTRKPRCSSKQKANTRLKGPSIALRILSWRMTKYWCWINHHSNQKKTPWPRSSRTNKATLRKSTSIALQACTSSISSAPSTLSDNSFPNWRKVAK